MSKRGKDPRGKDFADIAYTLLIVKKLSAMERVADRLDMSYATLHSRLINRTCFSADEIRSLIAVTGSAKLVTYLLEGTKYIAVERVAPEPDMSRTIRSSVTRVVVNAADILDSIDGALSDQRIDHREGPRILEEIEQALRTLAALKLKVEATGAGAGASASG